MPGPAAAGSYRAVLLLPSASRAFAPALGGRLAYGLLPLALLFTIFQTTGSYAVAGAALAVFGLTSIVLPAKARLADRYGQRRTLPWMALACAVGLAGVALTHWPVPFVALAGLAAPPLGPAMRSTWRTLTAGTGLTERAYALDAIAEETLYLVGPLLSGLLIAVAPARWALLLTAALLATGTLAMAAAAPARARPGEPGGRLFDAGPLRSAGLRWLLVVPVVVGAGLSVAYTGTAAVAQAAGRPGAAGLVEAGVAAGSVVGGLLWARRGQIGQLARPAGARESSRARQIAGLLGLFAVGLLAAAALAGSGLLFLGVALGLAGLAIAPLYVVAYLAADELAPPAHRTEAGAWVNVAANAGSAGGAAGAGLITEQAGPARALLVAGLLLAVTALAAGAARTRTVAPAEVG